MRGEWGLIRVGRSYIVGAALAAKPKYIAAKAAPTVMPNKLACLQFPIP